jgi:hypothetical protein
VSGLLSVTSGNVFTSEGGKSTPFAFSLSSMSPQGVFTTTAKPVLPTATPSTSIPSTSQSTLLGGEGTSKSPWSMPLSGLLAQQPKSATPTPSQITSSTPGHSAPTLRLSATPVTTQVALTSGSVGQPHTRDSSLSLANTPLSQLNRYSSQGPMVPPPAYNTPQVVGTQDKIR